MKDWHKLKPSLFRKQPYYLPGCNIMAGATIMAFTAMALPQMALANAMIFGSLEDGAEVWPWSC